MEMIILFVFYLCFNEWKVCFYLMINQLRMFYCPLFVELNVVEHRWSSGPKMVWTVEADHHFLILLQGYYREHSSLSKIDTHSWKRFEDEMSQFFHTKSLYRKLQAKRDQLRQVYRA